MAGSDNVIINTRERPVSVDQNSMQALLSRTVADLWRYAIARTEQLAVGTPPVDTVQDAVLGGLTITPSGNNISIAAGALLQVDSTLSPTPGTYDADYRIAINRAAEIVTMPSPVGETFYLVEAQMENVVVLNESRGILDAGSGNFVPTLVDKIAERQIAFQVVTGAASAPAPSGAPWVPIAVVRRPPGGGAVVNTDIYDVRPKWEDRFEAAGGGNPLPTPVGGSLAGDYIDGSISTESNFLAAGDTVNLTTLSARCRLPNGRIAAFDNDATAFSPESATYLETGLVLAANTFYYLYLCPWNDLTPRGQMAAGTSKGILILSDSATSGVGRRNGNALTLPPPWANSTVAASEAVLVGILRRNAGNTGWVAMSAPDGRTYTIKPLAAVASGSIGPLVAWAGTVTALPNPSGTRTRRVTVNVQVTGHTVNGTSADSQFVAVHPVAGSITDAYLDFFTPLKGIHLDFELPNAVAGSTLGVSGEVRLLGAVDDDTVTVNIFANVNGWTL